VAGRVGLIVPEFELNLDGIPGPTHHFGGLGYGNVASRTHAGMVSSPLSAGLQAIDKMRLMVDLGVCQGVLPPHPRPVHVTGYGDVYSSSAMWAANAATITAATDSADGRVHITPANLVSNLHRAVEAPFTMTMLKRLFHDTTFFEVHDPVVSSFPDEGAANWTRLVNSSGRAVYVATYGRSVSTPSALPATVVPRQSLEALDWIVRSHQLPRDSVVMLQQAPEAIEVGVFHNDVIATGIESTYFMHCKAYRESPSDIQRRLSGVRVVAFSDQDLSVPDAVASYWFNSQLVKCSDGRVVMLAPSGCRTMAQSVAIQSRFRDAGVSEIYWISLSESLRNGGGPACVRLRIPLSQAALDAIHPQIMMTHSRLDELERWMRRWYRESLRLDELESPELLRESEDALSELGCVLSLAEIFNDQYNRGLPLT